MKDSDLVTFLQWALPRLNMCWDGFRKVRSQVGKRIDKRITELGLQDEVAYRSFLDLHSEEWSILDGLCRISISRFYRDRSVFDCLRDVVLPELAKKAKPRGDGEVKCWCVGCASGEEVYTLRIIFGLGVQTKYPESSLQIFATDSDPNMLERAQSGRYTSSSLKDFPKEWLNMAFIRTHGLFSVKPTFRERIRYQQRDIRSHVPRGKFDLILCRHLVFTYFDKDLQKEILDKILKHLQEDGILVTGKKEILPYQSESLKALIPHSGIYQKIS